VYIFSLARKARKASEEEEEVETREGLYYFFSYTIFFCMCFFSYFHRMIEMNFRI